MSANKNIDLIKNLFGGDKSTLSADDEYNLRTTDYEMIMPQSGEKIVGREKMREFQKAYPNPPDINIRRIFGTDEIVVVEAFSDYGTEETYVCNIIEFKNGKICKETRYYASPFEPPEWRSKWVEPINS